jgi:transcription initiation factor TFIID subunit TAF12
MSAPTSENERVAAQGKENYINRHEQIMEKEQQCTQRREQEGEDYNKRRERER